MDSKTHKMTSETHDTKRHTITTKYAQNNCREKQKDFKHTQNYIKKISETRNYSKILKRENTLFFKDLRHKNLLLETTKREKTTLKDL